MMKMVFAFYTHIVNFVMNISLMKKNSINICKKNIWLVRFADKVKNLDIIMSIRIWKPIIKCLTLFVMIKNVKKRDLLLLQLVLKKNYTYNKYIHMV